MSQTSMPTPEEFAAWRLTHPPMAGGSGDPEAPAGDTAVTDQPAGTADTAPAPASSGGQGEHTTDGPAFEAPFRLEDVDESYREHVARYVKQVQGAFTTKTQELAAQRQQVAPLADLQARLEAEDTRPAALRELAEQFGIELEFEDDEPVSEPVVFNPEDFADDPVAQELARLRDQLAAREARDAETAAERQRQAYVDSFRESYDAGLNQYAKTQDLAGADKLPAHDVQAINGYLSQLAPLENGMPDMEGAISLHEAAKAATLEAYLATKRPGGIPVVADGVTGTPAFDPRDPKARLQRANAIAGRHLS